jgi:hypothetical protein
MRDAGVWSTSAAKFSAMPDSHGVIAGAVFCILNCSYRSGNEVDTASPQPLLEKVNQHNSQGKLKHVSVAVHLETRLPADALGYSLISETSNALSSAIKYCMLGCLADHPVCLSCCVSCYVACQETSASTLCE